MSEKMNINDEESINKKMDLILAGFHKLDMKKFKDLLGTIKSLEASLDLLLLWLGNFEKNVEATKPNLEKTLTKVGEVRAKVNEICEKLEVARKEKLN